MKSRRSQCWLSRVNMDIVFLRLFMIFDHLFGYFIYFVYFVYLIYFIYLYILYYIHLEVTQQHNERVTRSRRSETSSPERKSGTWHGAELFPDVILGTLSGTHPENFPELIPWVRDYWSFVHIRLVVCIYIILILHKIQKQNMQNIQNILNI